MTIDVIRLAREAGIAPKPMTIDGVEYEYQHVEFNDNIGGDEFGCIERFAALVAAEERNACAIACEVHAASVINDGKQSAWAIAHECATAIRARKPA